MDLYNEETEFPDIDVMRRVVDMFDRRPNIQRIIQCGLLGIDYSNEGTTADVYDTWARNGGSLYQPPLRHYTAVHDPSCLGSIRFVPQGSDTDRQVKLIQESVRSKEKSEKKRLKKQKQKQRKELEKVKKEKQNPKKCEEGKDAANQSEAEESKLVSDKDKDDKNSKVKASASAKDADTSDSSGHESSDEEEDNQNDSNDSEELDMTSTFVSKAALIAKRKLEQRPKAEKKEKKKIPNKEQRKTVPEKPNQDQEGEKKDSAARSSPSFEDNVKTSTELANIGNKFASAGDYHKAVKYFTDAIKFNPTEFKLFGNRSFCFEKLQEYDKALADAELSIGICPGWVKGLYRKGRALAGLKRYDEAVQAFRDVLKLDSLCAEAAQELMRVQIIQLMGYGFTREQSSNALIIHGTVPKALEVLSNLNPQPGAVQSSAVPPVQVANVTGVSPVLSANIVPAGATAAPSPPPAAPAARKPLLSTPMHPVPNAPNGPSRPKPLYTQPMKNNSNNSRPPELFPVWVGNLNAPVTESVITNMFNKVGVVYSVKLLIEKRCAFVNFTKQEHCDEAIRRLNGFQLNDMEIVVRYPDRIPPGMGISKSAHRADGPQDENVRQNEHVDRRYPAGVRRFVPPYKSAPGHRGNY
ncbi:tetratricopeptide repeat protein 31-like [Mugil cephalus]|uniref:tetratricopeptide repeat protein 31-like n=1 Tax=Mugil cephalus TaxID=48193 RepID=UPI001FB81F3D|nr:tetratricopeptide repeat protein 31-like [Mugil cephalus]